MSNWKIIVSSLLVPEQLFLKLLYLIFCARKNALGLSTISFYFSKLYHEHAWFKSADNLPLK